jgi:hypothetical protein
VINCADYYTDMAAGTAFYTMSIAVGNAIGAAIAGGMWTSENLKYRLQESHVVLTELFLLPALLPRKLRANLPTEDVIYVEEIEGSITAALAFPWGTSTRDAINESFTSTFRTMLLVSLILVAVALVCSLLLQNHNIREVDNSREYKGIVIGKTRAVDILKEKVHVGHDGKPPVTAGSS